MHVRFYNSFSFICVFLVLINEVSLQETVKAVIGGSVLLPSSSSEHDLKLQDINVHWRHNDSKIVYDIIKGKESLELQDPLYKNRAETFREEYERGNFSIKLNNLQYSDRGKYICLITHSSELQTVQLIITESTTEKEKLTDGGKTRENVDLLWVYIVLPVVIMLIVGVIIFLLRKKIQALKPLSVV